MSHRKSKTQARTTKIWTTKLALDSDRINVSTTDAVIDGDCAQTPFGVLYKTSGEWHLSEADARVQLRVMIAADRERFKQALAKLDEFEKTLDSGSPLQIEHITWL